MPSNYLAYLGLAILLVIAPGPDFAVVTKNCLMYGRRAGLFTSFGVVSSLIIQGLAAALGIAALIVRSATAFNSLKIVGAIYLGFLGFQALRAAFKRGRAPLDEDEDETAPANQAAAAQAAAANAEAPEQAAVQTATRNRLLLRGYRQGLLSNISNPKVLAFYFSLLPQFVNKAHPALTQVLVLAFTHAFFALIWLLIVVAVLERLRAVLRRPRPQRILEGFTGLALVSFGIGLLSTARSI